MNIICPECKNEVDISAKQDLKVNDIVECNHCGITLSINNIEGDKISTDITDEGK